MEPINNWRLHPKAKASLAVAIAICQIMCWSSEGAMFMLTLAFSTLLMSFFIVPHASVWVQTPKVKQIE